MLFLLIYPRIYVIICTYEVVMVRTIEFKDYKNKNLLYYPVQEALSQNMTFHESTRTIGST